MKKMRKIFTLLVGMLLLSAMSYGQAGDASFVLPTMTAQPGDKIVVPITFQGVTTLASMGVGFGWDNTVLKFDTVKFIKTAGGYDNIPKDENDIAIESEFPNMNTYILSWFSVAGVTLVPAGSVVLELHFTYLGGTTDLTFDPSVCLATNKAVLDYTLTLVNGKVSKATTPINITTQPVDVAVCDNLPASFSLVADGQTSYLWQVKASGGSIWGDVSTDPGFDIANATIDMNGNMYRCILSNADNTVTSNEVTLTVYALPEVTINKVGANLSVTAGLNSYQWYYNGGQIDGATNNTYTATQTGTYYVHVTNEHCSFDAAPVDVEVNAALQIFEVTATQNPICKGNSTKLDVTITGGTGNINYLWTPGNGTESSFTVTPDSPTTYKVVVTDDLTSVEQTIDIDVNPIPVASISYEPGANIFCEGGNVLLTAFSAPGYSYQWKLDGVILDGASLDTYPASIAGNYTVDVNSLGCSNTSAPTSVTVNPIPAVSISPSTTQNITEGGSALLTAVTEATVTNWKKDGLSLGVSTPTYSATETGLYTVVVTNGPCENESNPGVQVNVKALLPMEITAITANPTPICAGQTSTISVEVIEGSGDYSYLWSNDEILSSFEVTPSETTTYYVTVTDNVTLLTIESNVILTVNPLPVAEITPANPDPVTSPETVTLSASVGEGFSYVWYKDGVVIDNQFDANLVATTTGQYFVVITANNCPSLPSNPVDVTINPAAFDFTISMSAKNNPICKGETVTLQASVFPTEGLNYTWIWSNGKEIMNFNDTPTETTTYFVTITETTNNVTKEAQVTVTVDTPPTADLTPAGPKTIVEGQQVTLQATTGTGYTYVWLKNAIVIQNETNDNLVVTSAGIYQVIIHSGVCSANSNLVTINTVHPVEIVVSASRTTICEGESVNINAEVTNGSGEFSYIWSNDQTVSNFDITPSGTTVYSVTVTDNVTNETITGSVEVTVNTIPTAEINALGETTFCAGGSVELAATTGEGYTYQWRNGEIDILDATNANYIATANGVYSVRVTHLTCTATSNEIPVIVNQLPIVTLNFTGTQIIYEPNTIDLIAPNNAAYSYKWFKDGGEIIGQTTNTLIVNQSGIYTVEVTTNGCSATSEGVTVMVKVPGVCDLNVPTNLRVVDKTISKVTLAWDKVNAEADTSFVVRIYQAGTTNYIYKVLVDGIATVSKYGLLPCTDYVAEVRARCISHPDGKLHKSAYTAPIFFKTLCEADVCTGAKNLQSSSMTNTTAQVNFTGSVNATSYTVRYIGNQPGMTYHFRQTATPSILLQWLKPGTDYTWDVKVFCNGLGTKVFYGNQGHFTTTGVYAGKTIANDSKNVDFSVYPNPSNGIFTVSVDGIENNVNMTVQNLQGQVVYNKVYTNSFTEDVDLTGLAKGVYFIKLMNDNTNQVRKIVIQ